ncbi:hypothetical protein N5D66_14720 [Delftia tsuruhatensis]|uniref:hypothetical protein n=1 Tax=Delftia tsuruhatensis TaxID=180282 RepID=UPI00244B8B5A|nr:hypothetical protein [Delftia tsuruhatensis]MDH0849190.1 hypothetical protein [Delftia tsuruhatensis]
MKERPILFSAPMVRALLAGTKTQTRRIAKPVRHPDLGNVYAPGALVLEHEPQHVIDRCCPYGRPGDRLWVRETHMNWWKLDPANPEGPRIFSHVAAFAADGYELEPGERWIPSIHMLRAASRITLDIKAVRVERLQDISEEDAKAEGAPGYEEGLDAPPPDGDHEWSYRASFQRLWEQINGPGAWAKNPWVWVVEFERAQAQQKGPAS